MACVSPMRPMLLRFGEDGIDTCSVNITGTCLSLWRLCVKGEQVWCMLLCAKMLCGNKKIVNSSFLWAQKQ